MKKISVILFAILYCIAIEAQVEMNIDIRHRGTALSPYQYGIFYEEINHAGEGGLYAEMVQNRSFESSQKAEISSWQPINVGSATSRIDTTSQSLMNSSQRRALRMVVSGISGRGVAGVANSGFWGMNIIKDSVYHGFFWIRMSEGSADKEFIVQLQNENGTKILGNAKIMGYMDNKWHKYSFDIKAIDSDKKGRLALLTNKNGIYYIDMVSLFPSTFHNRQNGLRKDLAQLLADLHPTFMRFPGGCYVEGVKSYDEAFQWKRTLGNVEKRTGHFNRNWGYYVTDGLGFDEFLQFCEDIGASPMFVVNVGLGHEYQIPVDNLDSLVQDALDAIEYANGDSSTYWGRLRIANGHTAPFNLKFIEIGNENYQADAKIHSQQYAERYYRFFKAIKEKYPYIMTIGNVDAWGHDNPIWLNLYPVEMVDEHYYRSYTWMRNNYTKYDNRMRNFLIYNGEYAANGEGKGLANMNSALSEAIYMLGMEKNSDICRMASFAPSFVNENDCRWKYDMIHFNSSNIFVTPSYYVQKMIFCNVGKQNLKWTETGNIISTTDTLHNKELTDKRLVYQAVSVDDESKMMYVKIVNPNSINATVRLNLIGMTASYTTVIRLQGKSGSEENTMINPYNIMPSEESPVDDLQVLSIPAYSLNIY